MVLFGGFFIPKIVVYLPKNNLKMGEVKKFLEDNFLHFNAAALVDAAKGYEVHLNKGGKMMISLAGAMSTAELGKTLAEMIRCNKVHIICCTGANLEEDIFNLVAHDFYKRVPNYRDLTPQDEAALLSHHLNRVTDTCIPEGEAFRRIEKHMLDIWHEDYKLYPGKNDSQRKFPHEYFYKLINDGTLKQYYQIDPKNSWMVAAAEKNLPIIVPGWEDSTIGNMFAAACIRKEIKPYILKTGIDYMIFLAEWYQKNCGGQGVGFFQVGGGIAGDFPQCMVPMLDQDLQIPNIPTWSYYCQVSDSTTSYGNFSSCSPNEKITWGKLSVDTPKFWIESDATIVVPLVFAYLLNL